MAARKTADRRARAGGAKCPICGKPRLADYRPFCSRRCADVDLGRWLSEGYAMPLPEGEGDGEADDPEQG